MTIPAWALKKAIDFGGEVGDGQNAIYPLARLLVSTREAALREAAKEAEALAAIMSVGSSSSSTSPGTCGALRVAMGLRPLRVDSVGMVGSVMSVGGRFPDFHRLARWLRVFPAITGSGGTMRRSHSCLSCSPSACLGSASRLRYPSSVDFGISVLSAIFSTLRPVRRKSSITCHQLIRKPWVSSCINILR